MPVRDFDAARRERLRIREEDPIQFKLGGKTFSVTSGPPLADIFDLADAPEIDADDSAALRALDKFIRALIQPEQLDAWDKVLSVRGKNQVDGYALLEIAEYLSDELSGRPLDSSSGSSNGVSPITKNSNGAPTRKRKAS